MKSIKQTIKEFANKHSYNTWAELMYDSHDVVQEDYTKKVIKAYTDEFALSLITWLRKNRAANMLLNQNAVKSIDNKVATEKELLKMFKNDTTINNKRRVRYS